MLAVEFLNAHHGDCVVLTWAGDRHAILVDGGPSKVYDQALRPRLAALPRSASLEIVCVTHVDDDHVAGVIRLLNELNRSRRDGEAALVRIERLWFNSVDDVAEAVAPGVSSAPWLAAENGQPSGAVGASYRQGREVHRLRSALQLTGNAPFDRVVRQGDGVHLPGDVHVDVIAPDQPALTALAEKWRAAEQARNPAVIAAAIEDRSVPNLSSICLLVTHGGRTVLLTGDARGDHVLSGLASGGFLGDGPLLTDVLKLPHHGSANNVSPEFFRRIHASHYVISTDGRKHRHPDPQTLTWLVESRSPVDYYTIHFTNQVAAVTGHLEELRKGRSFETNLLQDQTAVIRVGPPAE